MEWYEGGWDHPITRLAKVACGILGHKYKVETFTSRQVMPLTMRFRHRVVTCERYCGFNQNKSYPLFTTLDSAMAYLQWYVKEWDGRS